jgi:hypothetical protein
MEMIQYQTGYDRCACLFIDENSRHRADEFERWILRGIQRMTWQPYSRDQTQWLDLSILGLQKRELPGIGARSDSKPQIYQRVCLVCALQKETTFPHVFRAVRRGRIGPREDGTTMHRSMCIEKTSADNMVV